MLSSEYNSHNKRVFARFDATDASATIERLVEAIEHDGGVIVKNLISSSLAWQIKSDLKPYFDNDIPDKYGFFPLTTKRATSLFARSDACIELACNPRYISVANALVSSSHTFWRGDHKETVTGKPIISTTVGFRVEPGGKQQVLHRDDKLVDSPSLLKRLTDNVISDYHVGDAEKPVMIGCVTALTKTTKENGATIAIPGSHLWGPERRPLNEEAVPAELNPGDALIFLGNLYHAGGANFTQ